MRFLDACPCCAAAEAEAGTATPAERRPAAGGHGRLPRRAWLRGVGGLFALSATGCAATPPVFNAEPRRTAEPYRAPDYAASPYAAPSPQADAAPRALPARLAGGAARSLRVRRAATGDSFAGVYWRDGRYDREALAKLNDLFRDPGRDETTPMDPRLFDVLHILSTRIGSHEPYELLSAYRSPETNAANARRSRAVSRVSLHMSGMAADVRLPDRAPLALARLAAEMQTGGVGLYRSGFVHLDCGPARRW